MKHYDSFNSVELHRSLGGAWYLKDVIASACDDIKNDIRIIAPAEPKDNADKHYNQAYQIWNTFEKEKGNKNEEMYWRIKQFLGCQPPLEKLVPLFMPVENLPDPDILVLNDLRLKFFDNDYKELEAFKKNGNPKNIIAKISSLQMLTPFLNFIINNYADKTTLVLSVGNLRERGAAISYGLSWDLTIEETVKEFEDGRSSLDLAKCKRVIIPFSKDSIASFSKGKLEYFLYNPLEHEGKFNDRIPGNFFGRVTILTAAMVRHTLEPSSYPLFLALGRGVSAVRANYEIGGGNNPDSFNIKTACEEIRKKLHPIGKNEPSGIFYTTINHKLLSDKDLCKQSTRTSDLLL